MWLLFRGSKTVISPPWPFSVLSMSLKDCLVATFPCFSTSEKHLRIALHFIMMNLNFLSLSFNMLQRSSKILLFIFFWSVKIIMDVAYLRVQLICK